MKELSDAGEKEILLAYEESEDENNLINNEVVKEKLENGTTRECFVTDLIIILKLFDTRKDPQKFNL